MMQSLTTTRPQGGRANRVDARYLYRQDANIETGTLQMRCRTVDISSGGVGISLWGTDSLTMGGTALVTIKGLPPLKGTIRWKKSDSFGVIFDERSIAKPELRALIAKLAADGHEAP